MDDEDLEEALSALKEIEEKGSIPFDEMKTKIHLGIFIGFSGLFEQKEQAGSVQPVSIHSLHFLQ